MRDPEMKCGCIDRDAIGAALPTNPDCWRCGGAGSIADRLHWLLLKKRALLYFAGSGGGFTFLLERWLQAGMSEYFVGASTPYRQDETMELLGHAPAEGWVSSAAAHDLAQVAYFGAARAQLRSGDASRIPIGVGCTVALASHQTPRGDQRAHAVILTPSGVWSWSQTYDKARGLEARRQQDRWLAESLTKSIDDAVTIPVGSENAERDARARFYLHPVFSPEGTRLPRTLTTPRIYVPATLNPITSGHRLLARKAEEMARDRYPELAAHPARFLVSSRTPHKEPLSVQRMLEVAAAVSLERWGEGGREVEFTQDEPLYVDKALARPGSAFALGADAMLRLVDPAWGADVKKAFELFHRLGTKFFVMGREVDGKWTECRDVKVSWPDGNLFVPLEGRDDISSTKERARLADGFRAGGAFLAPLTLDEIDRLNPGAVKKTIEELIGASSLGTPEVKALQAQAPAAVVAKVLARVDELEQQRVGPCLDPDQMHGAGDQFPGTDDPIPEGGFSTAAPCAHHPGEDCSCYCRFVGCSPSSCPGDFEEEKS